MINALDVRYEGRKSDAILNSLNGMHDRKLAGALSSEEFCNNIINTSDLISNCIKNGKIPVDEIESIEVLLTHLLSDDAGKYYHYHHKDYKRAGKTSLESIDIAKEQVIQRQQEAKPVMNAESYTKTFKKLG